MRTPPHAVLAGLVVGVLLALAPSCDPVPPTPPATCGPDNCDGCCDDTGACRSGTQSSACGSGGGTCSQCSSSQVCDQSACVNTGGDDGGTDGGDTDGGMDAGTGYANVDEAADAFAQAFCEHFLRCGAVHDLMTCLEVMAQFDQLPDFGPQAASVKDGRQGFDGVQARACIEGFAQNATCGGGDWFESEASCQATLPGLVATNGSCYHHDECGKADFCSSTSTVCPGTCEARKAAGSNASSDRECQDGLYLYNGKCTAIVAVNGSCAATGGAMDLQRCALGHFCDPADEICKPQKAQGETCADSAECTPLLACQNGTCNPLAKLNETCNTSAFGMGQPDIACQFDLRCDFAQLGSPGVCRVRAKQGEDCWLTAIDCADGLFCDGATLFPTPARGTCQPQRASGATCQLAEQCADGLYCSMNQCTDKKAAGAACANSGECAAGLTCSQGMCRAAACSDPTP